MKGVSGGCPGQWHVTSRGLFKGYAYAIGQSGHKITKKIAKSLQKPKIILTFAPQTWGISSSG
jgi:hypothetical protein